MMNKDAEPEKAHEAGDSEEHAPLTFLQTLQSVAWAMLGVQSKKNAKRDFSKGKPSHFIVIGIMFAGIFVLSLVSIIQILLNRID